jgi:zinc protease
MRDRHLVVRELPLRRLLAPYLVPLVLVLLQQLVAVRAEAGVEIDDPAERVERTVLANGLTVLTLEDRVTPVVSFQMWTHAGSSDESRFTGIAHLFEHMMFKGSENVGPEEHARLIESRGGRINAFTSRDVTVYHEDVTSESLPLVIDLEAERLANLDIGQRTLDSERQVVLEERRLRSEDSPHGRAFEALAALTWQAHSYRWPVIGWRSDVEQVSVDACREFFSSYYVPSNVVLAIVGDFDTRATLQHIKRAFGRLEGRRDIPRNLTREPEQRGERRATIHFDLRSPVLAAAWHAPAAGHADAPALDAASQILSAGRSSRLYRSLVYEQQLALFAEGAYWELEEAGLFYAFVGVRPDADIDQAEQLFYSEIERVARDSVSPGELEKAKRQLEVSLVNGLATAHALASRIGRDTVTFGRIRPLRERLDAIAAVTREDVQRVVRSYLVPERRSVVHVIPRPVPEAGSEGVAETEPDASPTEGDQ